MFRYQVVRVWQLPPEPLLTGGLALLPLAPISAVTAAELPGIIERMKQRLRGRGGRQQAELVWAAAYILLGLRHSPALAAQLFRGVVSMKESSTYQAILEEGARRGEPRAAPRGEPRAAPRAHRGRRCRGEETVTRLWGEVLRPARRPDRSGHRTNPRPGAAGGVVRSAACCGKLAGIARPAARRPPARSAAGPLKPRDRGKRGPVRVSAGPENGSGHLAICVGLPGLGQLTGRG